MNKSKKAAPKDGGGDKVLISGRYVLLTLPDVSGSDIADAIRIVEAKEEAGAGEESI